MLAVNLSRHLTRCASRAIGFGSRTNLATSVRLVNSLGQNLKVNSGQVSLSADKDFLTLSFPEKLENPDKFAHVWLRDHCRCPKCYSSTTFQREFSLRDLPVRPTPKDTFLDEDVLKITWDDGHKSEYPINWLCEHSHSSYKARLARSYERRVMWSGNEFQSLPVARIPVQNVLDKSNLESRRKAFESLWDFGVVFIEGVASTVKATREAVEALGLPMMKCMWGEDPHVFEADGSRSDSAYSTQFIGSHNDNTYFTEPAGLLGLACFSHEGTGGENKLLDGLKIAATFQEVDPEGYEFLSRNPIPSEFREETDKHRYHFLNNECVFKHDPLTGHLTQMRYNIYDRAPMSNMPAEKTIAFYEHYRKLSEVIEDMERDHWVKLKPGTIMLFDNFRLLHARTGFTGRRVMVSCYVPRGEFMSGARICGLTP